MSRDEDSPQSIASLATRNGLISFVGINSSSASQKAGKNEHLRSFELDLPLKRSGANGTIGFLGQAALFNHTRGSANQAFQRLLRLSPVRSRDAVSKRLGVMATGMAAERNEVVVFDATTNLPGKDSICAHLKLPKDDEAVDLDIFEPTPGTFDIAYCTDYNIYLYSLRHDFASKTSRPTSFEPSVIYSRPEGDAAARSRARTKLRCLRWLSSRHLLGLQNLPDAQGAELFILRLNEAGEPALVTLRKTLPSKVKSAVGLDVCFLDADPGSGERQIVVAVHSKDGTVPIFTLNHLPENPDIYGQVSQFSDYETVPSMHRTNVTKICLSNFFAPKQPEHSTTSIAASTQHIQLASVALGGTVVVCSIALTSVPTSPAKTAIASAKPRNAPNVRWVLSDAKTQRLQSLTGRVLIALFVLVFAVALRAYLSADPRAVEAVFASLRSTRGKPPTNWAQQAEAKVAEPIGKPASIQVGGASTSVSSAISAAVDTAQAVASQVVESIHPDNLRDVLREQSAAREDANPDQPAKAIHIATDASTNEMEANLHPEEDIDELRKNGARTFEELSHVEQQKWKKRLIETGHWAEDLPATILKSVLFSEYAGVVGGAIRDAVLQ